MLNYQNGLASSGIIGLTDCRTIRIKMGRKLRDWD